MPVEPYEIIRLIIGLLILTIPGYLWSKFFFKNLSVIERTVFGFLAGLALITLACFMLNAVLSLHITQLLFVILFSIYSIPALFLYIHMFFKKNKTTRTCTFHCIVNKKLLVLCCILIFTFIMVSLPHITNQYYLPFHVDEWEHWTYTKGLMNTGNTTFTNPYTGSGITAHPEIGFHLATALIIWITGANISTIFLLMPPLIGVGLGLLAFSIGERSYKKHGLESAFLIAFIPTTIRFLGPSFYVASTLGLIYLLFIIWLCTLKNIKATLVIAFSIWCLFIIHPVTALAGLIILLVYILFLLIEKNIRVALLTSAIIFIPLLIMFIVTTQWSYTYDLIFQALLGKQDPLLHMRIWPDFNHLSIITWILFLFGVYLSIAKGKIISRTLSIAAMLFILIIGVYDRFGYGLEIVYERSFLYLFLIVAVLAGLGFAELRTKLQELIITKKIKNQTIKQYTGIITSALICILIIGTATPAHLSNEYYKLISEEQYTTFTWLQDNINTYRNETNAYDKAAVDPYIASPFTAITGIYTISNRMSPLYCYELHEAMTTFLLEKCLNTSFLDRYQLSVIYGDAENSNLTKIYDQVYLYPGLQTR